jgi:O-antigen/teichoic acid export membrane protein
MLKNLFYAAKNTFIYSLGNLSVKLIGVFLLPIYLKELSTAEYGILAVLEVTSQLIVDMSSLNLPVAMLRWGAAENDLVNRKKIVFTALLPTVVISLLLVLILFPFSDNLSLLFFSSIKYNDYISLLFISSAIAIINNIPLNLIRLQQRSVFYVVLTTSGFLIILLLNVYFIVFCGYGVKGIIMSQLIGNAFVFLCTVPLILKNVSLSFEFKLLKDFLAYGIPLALSTVSGTILTFGDRYILNYFLPLSDVGVYTLGYKIASLIKVILLQSFQLGFIPIAFKMFESENSPKFFSKVLTYFVLVLITSSLILSLFGQEGIMLFTSNKSYFSAYTVVPLISFSFVITGMRYMFALGFHYSKKTKYNAYIVVFGVIFNTLLNFVLVPWLKYYGSALSALISVILMTILTLYYSQKFYRIPYELKKMGILISVSIALYLLSIWVPVNGMTLVLFKLFLFISFPLVLYRLNFFDQVELERFKQILSDWRNPYNWKKNISRLLDK